MAVGLLLGLIAATGFAIAYDGGRHHSSLIIAIVLVLGVLVGGVLLGGNYRALSRSASESDLQKLGRNTFYIALLFSGAGILRPAAGLTTSDWLFAFAGCIALLDAIQHPNRMPANRASAVFTAGATFFLVGGVLSAWQSEDPTASMLVVARVLAVAIGLGWIASKLVTTAGQIVRATWFWCASAALTSLAAIIAATIGFVPQGAFAKTGRFSGLTEHPNELGAVCALTVAPAIYLAASSRTWLGKSAGWAILSLVVLGTMLSGSVNALVAATVAIIAWIVLSGARWGRLAAVAGIAVVSFAATLALLPSDVRTPFSRIDTNSSGLETNDSTFSSRLSTYEDAWNQINSQPLVGRGFGEGKTEAGFEVHNLILQTWYEGGALAATGILLILLAVFLRGRAIWADKGGSHGLSAGLTAALLASFLAFITYSMAALILYKRFAWISPAMITAAYTVVCAFSWAPRRAGIESLDSSNRFASSVPVPPAA